MTANTSARGNGFGTTSPLPIPAGMLNHPVFLNEQYRKHLAGQLQECFSGLGGNQALGEQFVEKATAMLLEAAVRLNGALTKDYQELWEVTQELMCHRILVEETPDLALTEREKLAALLEGVELNPDDPFGDFTHKLKIARDIHFPRTNKQHPSLDDLHEGPPAEMKEIVVGMQRLARR